MAWLHNYLLFCVLYPITLISFYAIGKALLLVLSRRFAIANLSAYEDIFISTSVGAVLSVLVFSVLITSGRTVNVLFLPVAALLFFSARKQDAPAPTRFLPSLSRSEVGSLIFYAVLIYTFFACVILRFSDWTSVLSTPALFDWGLYGADMTAMIRTGQENHTHVNLLLDADYGGMTLYHFFEIWMAAIWHLFLPHLLPIYVLTLLSYSICAFITLIGCWAFLRNFVELRWYHRALAFACFFSAGWFIVNVDFLKSTFLDPFLGNLRDMNLFALFLPKRLVPLIFLLLSLLFLIRKQIAPSFVCLLSLPIVSIDSTPAVVGATFLYGVVGAIRNQDRRREWLMIASAYILFFLCFALLYRTFGNHNVRLYNPLLTLARLVRPERGTELFPFLFFGRAVVQLFLLYSFHGAIFYWLWHNRPELQQTCWLLFLLVIAGAVGWGALYLYIDGIQFFISILTIAQTLILICGITLLSSSGRIPRLLIALYIAGTAVFNFSHFYADSHLRASLGYSTSYLNRISTLSPESQVGISVESKKDFEPNWGIRNVMAHALGDMYVIFMPQYTKAVAINVFVVPETPFRERTKRLPLLNVPLNFEAMDAFRSRMMKQSGVFYRFFEKVKRRRPGITVEEAEVAFIDYYKIDWGIISPNAKISPLLEGRVILSEIDPASGDRFVLLKNHEDTKTQRSTK